MGCTSEKCIPEYSNKNNEHIISEDNIEINIHDIEQQGESKHPQKIVVNNTNEEEENNYYNYNLNDLVLVNKTKMTVKRIENFDDDDDDESESEDSNSQNLKGIKEENDEIENDEIEKGNDNEIQENINNMPKSENEMEKKVPEDKKPPNISKLKKKGKEKPEIKSVKVDLRSVVISERPLSISCI